MNPSSWPGFLNKILGPGAEIAPETCFKSVSSITFSNILLPTTLQRRFGDQDYSSLNSQVGYGLSSNMLTGKY